MKRDHFLVPPASKRAHNIWNFILKLMIVLALNKTQTWVLLILYTDLIYLIANLFGVYFLKDRTADISFATTPH
jgi:hypothetical protein